MPFVLAWIEACSITVNHRWLSTEAISRLSRVTPSFGRNTAKQRDLVLNAAAVDFERTPR